MTTYAALTDGTTTITFASPGTLGWYRIETGWTPKVAGLRQNQLGGRGPYEDVTEEIPVSIGGSTAAHMYANMRGLQDLLWKSNRWYRDENVAAVLFKYSPEGATTSTTASPLQAAVWNSALDLSGGFSGIPQSGSAVWTSGATLRFSRNGAWIHTSASASAAGSNGSPVLVTLASTAYDSPTKVTFTGFLSNYQQNTPVNSFLIISDDSSAITIGEAGSFSTSPSSEWAAGSDAYLPLGGSVMTFNKTVFSSAGSYASITYSSLSLSSSPKNYAVFANIRGVSAASYPTLNISIGASSSFIMSSQRSLYDFVVPTAGANANWKFIGIVPVNFPATYLQLQVRMPGWSGSPSCTFKLDTILLADMEHSRILEFRPPNTSGVLYQEQIVVDHRAMSKAYPSVAGSSGNIVTSYGNSYISTQGGSLYCTLLSTSTQDADSYNFRSSSAGSVMSNTWNVTRSTAYLTPE